ncbi:MAG: transglycosylase SLT domain-containing protein [Pyrinomonadaceae bacterium]
MLEIVLTYSANEDSGEIFIEREKTSFGRGGDADQRFEDDGLSRLHASIYREDDQVWIIDENSSNGTFVNGKKVSPSGSPLRDGDTIKIGHYTNLRVNISEKSEYSDEYDAPAETGSYPMVSTSSETAEKPSIMIPLVITAAAFLVICSAAVFIGVNVLGNNQPAYVENHDDEDYPADDADPDINRDTENDTGTSSANDDTNESSDDSPSITPTNTAGTEITDSPTVGRTDDSVKLPTGKNYQAMSDSEKNQYVKVRSEKVARMIGNNSSESIPADAIAQIRRWLDGYSGRIRGNRVNDCGGTTYLKSDMVSLLERAKDNAPYIIRSFNQKGVDPQIGLYLAMIESEHCPCLQSHTGPLGMYQFTYSTAKRFGLNVQQKASPSNPDERCNPEAAARASAGYMKSLTARIGTGPLSIPLAIASYNSGEGGLGKNLKTALEANESQERSFWTLVANSEKLAVQFQRENIKYVPKFFAAAIIGENPRDFGINLQPLSTYTK